MNKLTKDELLKAGVQSADAEKLLASDLSEREVGHLLLQPHVGEHLVLGYDADVPLVVVAGHVLALDGTRRLVNSTVAAFVDVLGRYQRYVAEVVGMANDEQGERVARQAVDDMQRLDPTAFQENISYWPIVCAQMIEGNL